MKTIWRVMSGPNFSNKADMEAFRTILTAHVNKALEDSGAKRFVGPEPLIKSYIWIEDGERVMYSCGVVADFENKEDRQVFINTFKPALVDELTNATKSAAFAYQQDRTGRACVLRLTEYSIPEDNREETLL